MVGMVATKEVQFLLYLLLPTEGSLLSTMKVYSVERWSYDKEHPHYDGSIPLMDDNHEYETLQSALDKFIELSIELEDEKSSTDWIDLMVINDDEKEEDPLVDHHTSYFFNKR